MQNIKNRLHRLLTFFRLRRRPGRAHIAVANVVPQLEASIAEFPKGSQDTTIADVLSSVTCAGETSETARRIAPSTRNRITLTGRDVFMQDASTPVAPVKCLKDRFRCMGRQIVPIADAFASVAEGVPLLGPIVKGPLDALVKILNGVEQRFQNTEDIEQLKEKLLRLDMQLKEYPLDAKIEGLISVLADKVLELERLLLTSGLDYRNVASAVSQCERDISHLIDQFSAILNVETHVLVKQQNERILALQLNGDHQAALLESIVAMLATSGGQLGLGARISINIWVIDPFGTKHSFMQFPSSYQALGHAMLQRYSHDSFRRPILERHVDRFELNQTDGRRATLVAEQDLCSLEAGTTVIMSIVTYSDRKVDRVQCPLCKTFIVVPSKDADRIFCITCDSNITVQISQDDQWGVNGPTQPEVAEKRVPQEDLDCLRQIVVRPTRQRIAGKSVTLDLGRAEAPNKSPDASTLPQFALSIDQGEGIAKVIERDPDMVTEDDATVEAPGLPSLELEAATTSLEAEATPIPSAGKDTGLAPERETVDTRARAAEVTPTESPLMVIAESAVREMQMDYLPDIDANWIAVPEMETMIAKSPEIEAIQTQGSEASSIQEGGTATIQEVESITRTYSEMGAIPMPDSKIEVATTPQTEMGTTETMTAPKKTMTMPRAMGRARQHPLPLQSTDVVVLVMGATGSGRSTYINSLLPLNSHRMSVKDISLTATTTAVEHRILDEAMVQYVLRTHKDFRIVLVDTPGFDNGHKPDSDVLRDIAQWSRQMVPEGGCRTGIVFLHDITNHFGSTSAIEPGRLRCATVAATSKWEFVDPRDERAERVHDTLRRKWTNIHKFATSSDASSILQDLIVKVEETPSKVDVGAVFEELSADWGRREREYERKPKRFLGLSLGALRGL